MQSIPITLSPAGDDLCGPGAPGGPGEGADRSPITMLYFRWQPVWCGGRCTRWARSRCRRIPTTLSIFRWQPVWARWARSRCRRIHNTPRIREHTGSVIGGRVPATQGSSGPCVYCRKPGVRSLYTYVASSLGKS